MGCLWLAQTVVPVSIPPGIEIPWGEILMGIVAFAVLIIQTVHGMLNRKLSSELANGMQKVSDLLADDRAAASENHHALLAVLTTTSDTLRTLADTLTRQDSSGRPMVYSPPELVPNQQLILTKVGKSRAEIAENKRAIEELAREIKD